jgi:hypothetical protein
MAAHSTTKPPWSRAERFLAIIWRSLKDMEQKLVQTKTTIPLFVCEKKSVFYADVEEKVSKVRPATLFRIINSSLLIARCQFRFCNREQ